MCVCVRVFWGGLLMLTFLCPFWSVKGWNQVEINDTGVQLLGSDMSFLKWFLTGLCTLQQTHSLTASQNKRPSIICVFCQEVTSAIKAVIFCLKETDSPSLSAALVARKFIMQLQQLLEVDLWWIFKGQCNNDTLEQDKAYSWLIDLYHHPMKINIYTPGNKQSLTLLEIV